MHNQLLSRCAVSVANGTALYKLVMPALGFLKGYSLKARSILRVSALFSHHQELANIDKTANTPIIAATEDFG